MARPLTPLGSMGAKTAEALADDAGVRERAIELARRAFSVQALQAQRSRRYLGRVLGFSVAAVFALGAAAYRLSARVTPLQFEVDGKPGVAQTWLAASGERPMVVTFADGTVLQVGTASRARVIESTEHSADISLESGSLHAHVVRSSSNAWGLVAGPFAVRGTGTRFDAKWEPTTQQFALSVSEGSVTVSGSVVGTERALRAGERLFASVVQGRLELSNSDGAAASAVVPPAPSSGAPPPNALPDSSTRPASEEH